MVRSDSFYLLRGDILKDETASNFAFKFNTMNSICQLKNNFFMLRIEHR